jgi:drug/metabolite transporter (DMT)-like permease
MRPFTPTNVLVLLAVGSLAASSFIFMKVLLDQISPQEIVLGRVVFGTLALAAVIRLKKTPLHLSRALLLKVSVFAVLETVLPFSLIASAEQRIDGGMAAIMISSMPLFTVVLATITPTGERLSAGGLAGLAVGFLGIVILSGIGSDSLRDGDALSRLAVLGGAASYAAAGVYARLYLRDEDTLKISGLQLGVATLIALPLAFIISGRPAFELDLTGLSALVTLGVAGSALMLVGFLWLVERTGSIGASLVTYVVPFVGAFLGWAVLGESISSQTFFGLILVLVGVAITMSGSLSVAEPTRSRAAPPQEGRLTGPATP